MRLSDEDLAKVLKAVEQVVKDHYAPPVVAELHARVVNAAREDIALAVKEGLRNLPSLIHREVVRQLASIVAVNVTAEITRTDAE